MKSDALTNYVADRGIFYGMRLEDHAVLRYWFSNTTMLNFTWKINIPLRLRWNVW